MVNWLERAKHQIPQKAGRPTAKTDERNPTAVTAVPQSGEAGNSHPARAGAVSADDDDRRRCDQCTNLTPRGLCLAARRDEIVASRNYEPVRDFPRRCEGYAPGPNDADRRPGRVRWPGLG